MSAKTYHITLNGKVYEVEIEEVQQGQKSKQSVSQQYIPKAVEEGEEVTSPMPGNIFNILVKEGQQVRKGEVIAILEAMKMENEIVAPIDGKISSVNVQKGQNVNLGDLILKMA